ncbi:uncharacterized protein LY89DRAFT_771376 [Mollisia scopiformis]|uniref:Uncharacterized protein n=1 Tax=Mollisia scopiformis TaxID=149040 RepID=A0A194XK07_MOLSC|nr:uncharacterized protein LY89DRAFT_771376 [Mollisia scopiformis]KUJ20471.1 hypothetical protein LY89DRAFT_771376 [Mollisia scopiformis]
MSSQPTPVLQIDHPSSRELSPADRSSLEDTYFSSKPAKKRRNASPGALSLPQTPSVPFTLVKTPPPNEQPRQNDDYFSPPPQRVTRTATPSDNASNIYSSSLSPSGGSFHSSDIGRTTCSGSSSEFLTPPLFQGDNDNPPYKVRRGSTTSLTMIKKLRRANTMPYDKEAKKKVKRQHSKRHKCRHRKVTMDEHRSQSHWWLPGCQVVPTAPRGQKDMCEGHGGHHTKSKLRNADTSDRLTISMTPKLKTTSARRWSSVEIGAHQIISELTSTLPPVSSAVLASPTSEDATIIQPFDPRFRSSTFTRGAVDNDIVRTVRERLALRRIPSAQLKTPASITLRRASVLSSRSGTSQTPSTFLKSEEPSGGSTPLARLQGLLKQRRPSAYLITSQDIESITELIEENLKRKYGKKLYTKSTNSSSAGSGSPSITSKGVVIPPSFPDLGVTVAEAQTRSGPFDYLQVVPVRKARNILTRVASQRSVHEVIWQGGSPNSPSSTTEEEELKRSPYCECSQGFGMPRDMFQHHECKPSRNFSTTGDRSDAFDPKNANASINEWSSRTEQIDIPLVVTSSDSESNDISASNTNHFGHIAQRERVPVEGRASLTPKSRSKHKIRPVPRPAASDSNLHKSRSRGMTLEDVVSFPPLPPRKTTEEWYSPLPEMITTPPLTAARSLYDLGLDAYSGPRSSKSVTPKASQACLHRSADLSSPSTLSPARSIEFRPSFDLRKKSSAKGNATIGPVSQLDSAESNKGVDMRKKSIVKDHPTALPRAGDLSKMGSAIGSHGHERRRSSAVPAQKVQRVRTIDNVHKGEREVPSSKWRRPSVCPPRKPSSPGTADESKDSRPPSPANTARKFGAGFFDRMSLVRDRSPPQPKIDLVGIYGQLTGTKRAHTLRDPCLLESGPCEPHDCDDCDRDPRNPSVDWIG